MNLSPEAMKILSEYRDWRKLVWGPMHNDVETLSMFLIERLVETNRRLDALEQKLREPEVAQDLKALVNQVIDSIGSEK